ncbi:hypothetical protein EDEG_02059 [Edhazardia aedis USNM 41457]|uniref:Uncharacterized protein n=1 Tax=Edhazardia aedis (strain USNM 41457) TaxID=1003232 RepID=J8ZVG1_EDHAE|nr:hypothetical protein EDEG_02059 [Edhazardia aedis USNM 41457]|eukprot:EJW03628.1 hypothetical protein EDEG_02059 [Edhazardia aedis USNM 41457]
MKENIAMVCDFFYPNMGGIETHIEMLSTELIKLGHKVIVITHSYYADNHKITGLKYLKLNGINCINCDRNKINSKFHEDQKEKSLIIQDDQYKINSKLNFNQNEKFSKFLDSQKNLKAKNSKKVSDYEKYLSNAHNTSKNDTCLRYEKDKHEKENVEIYFQNNLHESFLGINEDNKKYKIDHKRLKNQVMQKNKVRSKDKFKIKKNKIECTIIRKNKVIIKEKTTSHYSNEQFDRNVEKNLAKCNKIDIEKPLMPSKFPKTHRFMKFNDKKCSKCLVKVYYLDIPIVAMNTSFPTLFCNFPLLYKIYKEENIKVVHGHQTMSNLAIESIFHAKTMNLKTVLTEHSLFDVGGLENLIVNKLSNFVLNDIDRCICVSYTAKENFLDRIKIDSQKVFVLPNCVRSEIFYPNTEKNIIDIDDDSTSKDFTNKNQDIDLNKKQNGRKSTTKNFVNGEINLNLKNMNSSNENFIVENSRCYNDANEKDNSQKSEKDRIFICKSENMKIYKSQIQKLIPHNRKYSSAKNTKKIAKTTRKIYNAQEISKNDLYNDKNSQKVFGQNFVSKKVTNSSFYDKSAKENNKNDGSNTYFCKNIKKYNNIKSSVKKNLESHILCSDTKTIKKQKYNNQTMKKITIIAISRLVERKGINLLITAIPKICKYNRNIHFILAGDGPKRPEVEQTIDQHNLHKQVSFIGELQHKDVPKLLRKGDIFVNTSLTEAFCLAILEAAACGLLVVSTNVGGIHEVLPDDLILLTDVNEQSVVDGVISAINKIQNGFTIDENYYTMIKTIYSWKYIAIETSNLYENIELCNVTLMKRIQNYGWSDFLLCILLIIEYIVFSIIKRCM